MAKTKYPDGFLTRVEEWVSKQPRISIDGAVKEVVEHGTDWAGDSFEGFHSEFYVTIETDKNYYTIEGEELGSLWSYVMTGWGND